MRYVHVVANRHADYRRRRIVLQIFFLAKPVISTYVFQAVLSLLVSAEAVLFSF